MSCVENEKQIMIDLAEQFVVRKDFCERDEGIHFCLKIDIENLGYEKDGNTNHPEWRARKMVYMHYLVIRPYSVFLALGESEELPPAAMFKNTSNHDSCWRTDGFTDIFTYFMRMYEACYNHVPSKHRSAPIMCNYNVHLRTKWLSGPVFDFVKVETEYDDDNYHKNLIKLEKIKKTIKI
jgi:hypothetical protein